MFPFSPARAFVLLVAVAAVLACGPRIVREPVLERRGTRVLLRGQVADGQPVDRGYQHPTVISPSRLSHILSRIDVRPGSGAERVPALQLEVLYDVAEGVSAALAKADSSQEVVVMSTRRQRRWGVFTDEFFTSFLAFVEGERLVLHFGHVEWPIPTGPDVKLLEPKLDQSPGKYRVLPADGLEAVGPQTLAVAWREEIFRESPVRIGPRGRVRRRTILLELEEEPAS